MRKPTSIHIPLQNALVCRAPRISVAREASAELCAVLARGLAELAAPVADPTAVSAAASRPLRPAPVEISRRTRRLPRVPVDILARRERVTVETDVELDVDFVGVIARAAGCERGAVGLNFTIDDADSRVCPDVCSGQQRAGKSHDDECAKLHVEWVEWA